MVEQGIRGINMDSSPLKQPEGFLTYALNGVNDDDLGSVGSLVNEVGNDTCFSLPSSYRPLGYISMQDETVIFSSDGTNSEIGLARQCTYTTLINDTCLNFSNTIKGIHKIIRGCERVIYFVDGTNPDRAINIDRLTDYQTGGSWDCDKMSLDRLFSDPCITSEVTEGGSLPRGYYEIYLEYTDELGNILGYSHLTRAVHVFDTKENTSKRIEVSISDIDDTVSKVNLMVHHNGASYEITTHTLTSTSFDYIITNLPSNRITTIDEALTPRAQYVSSQAIEEVDNRLVRANVKERVRDYSGYQSVINGYELKYVVSEVDADSHTPSFMRDEVYAFGIMYKYNDGSYSDVFHLPNLTNSCDSYTPTTCDDVSIDVDVEVDISTGEVIVSSASWDSGYDYYITVTVQKDYVLQTVQTDTITGGDVYDEFVSSPLYGSGSNFQVSVTVTPQASGCTFSRHISPTLIFTSTSSQSYTMTSVGGSLGSNTSSQDGTAISGFVSSGDMGCYACQEVYTDPSCTSFWDTIAGNNVSHFRMPSSTLEPLYNYSTSKVRALGVQLQNVTYPDSDIVGHYLMVANRNENDRTIVGKGLAGHVHDLTTATNSINYTGFSHLRATSSPDTNWSYFFGLDALYDDRELNGTQMSQESLINLTAPHVGETCATPLPTNSGGSEHTCQRVDGNGGWLFTGEKDIIVANKILQGESYTNTAGTADIVDSFYAHPYYFTRDIISNTNFVNSSMTNPIQFIKTDTQFTRLSDQISYVAIKNSRDVYCSLDDISYRKAGDCISTTTASFFAGDTYISDIKWSNTATAEYNNASVDNVFRVWAITWAIKAVIALAFVAPAAIPELAATLGPAAATLAVSAITALAARASVEFVRLQRELFDNEDMDEFMAEDLDNNDDSDCCLNGGDYVHFINTYLDKVFIEHEIDHEFRLSENGGCQDHFKFTTNPMTYSKDRNLLYSDGDKEPNANYTPCPEVYNYDTNLSYITSQLFPTFIYDCSDCPGEFPNRIIWSESSFSEDRQDFWRITLGNNFTDVSQNRGPITVIKYLSNLLLVHTTDATFTSRPNPRELTLDGSETAVIGTGSFLSIPFEEIRHADVSSAGCQGKYASLHTPFGYVWVDQKNARVYKYGEGLELLTTGMNRFFEENLRSDIIQNYYEQTGEDFPLDDAYVDFGQNVFLVYDPAYKRLIIRKRDYVPVWDYTIYDPLVSYNPTDKVFRTSDRTFRDATTLVKFTEFDNSNFENRSWTLSYSFVYNSYTSFHSYLPNIAYSDTRTFYSFDTAFFEHNKGNFTTYYGTKEDYIIEWIENNFQSFNEQSIQWISEAYLYDSVNKSWVYKDETYDSVWAYNDCESTNKISINQKTSDFDIVNDGSTYAWVENVEGTYKINRVRDVVSDRTVNPSTRAWANIANDYPIDKVPLTSAHDTTQSKFDTPRLLSKWVKTRLFFNPNTSLKIITNLLINKTKQSPR